MLTLLLILALVWLGLAVGLFVGTLWFQGFFYENTEPPGELAGRAPAAAAALTALLALWCWLDARPPVGRFKGLFAFDARDEKWMDKFWSVKRGQKTEFKGRKTGTAGKIEYFDEQGNRWKRSDTSGIVEELIFMDDGQEVRFKPETTPDGKFKIEPGQSLRFMEEGGKRREMIEDQLGNLSTIRYGILGANLLLNFFHLALWFVCLWLVLNLQWPHALGMAFVFWLAATLLLLPLLLTRAEEIGKQRAAAAATAANHRAPRLVLDREPRPYPVPVFAPPSPGGDTRMSFTGGTIPCVELSLSSRWPASPA